MRPSTAARWRGMSSPSTVDPPRARREQPQHDGDRGGLAGAVRAEQRRGRAGRHLEAEAVDRDHLAVALDQILHPNCWAHVLRSSCSPAGRHARDQIALPRCADQRRTGARDGGRSALLADHGAHADVDPGALVPDLQDVSPAPGIGGMVDEQAARGARRPKPARTEATGPDLGPRASSARSRHRRVRATRTSGCDQQTRFGPSSGRPR